LGEEYRSLSSSLAVAGSKQGVVLQLGSWARC
jgi:hypothetical protein